MKKTLLPLILFLFVAHVNSQQFILSPDAEISVLTIGQGRSLNDSFGHNGFRVKDKTNHIDFVYNYGVYDFETPNFYTKFAQGKLNYLIGINYYNDFFESYRAQNRTIKEQVLNLSLPEKQNLFNYLQNNNKPENRAYLYDFFYDNCATKIKDVANIVLKNNLTFHVPEAFKQETFRALIHKNINKNSWGSLGIDMALGSVIDRKATPEEHMFLPEYIFKFFGNASISNSDNKLVKQTNILYKKVERPVSTHFLTSPLMVFGIIGLLMLFITYKDYKKNTQSKWLDFALFIITGIIGIFILLLWFATDHEATHQNYNLLWANVLNLLVIHQLFRKKTGTWFLKYLKFSTILLCLIPLHWIIGIQVFAVGLIPFLCALFIRYIYLIKYYRNKVIVL